MYGLQKVFGSSLTGHSVAARYVYLLLLCYADDDGIARVTLPAIQRDSSLTRTVIEEALSDLQEDREDYGPLLKRSPAGWQFLHPEIWTENWTPEVARVR